MSGSDGACEEHTRRGDDDPPNRRDSGSCFEDSVYHGDGRLYNVLLIVFTLIVLCEPCKDVCMVKRWEQESAYLARQRGCDMDDARDSL